MSGTIDVRRNRWETSETNIRFEALASIRMLAPGAVSILGRALVGKQGQ